MAKAAGAGRGHAATAMIAVVTGKAIMSAAPRVNHHEKTMPMSLTPPALPRARCSS
jgi:hypothetical protein